MTFTVVFNLNPEDFTEEDGDEVDETAADEAMDDAIFTALNEIGATDINIKSEP